MDWRCPEHRDQYVLHGDAIKLAAALRDTFQTLDSLLRLLEPRGLNASAASLIEEHLCFADETIGQLRRKVDSLEAKKCKLCDGRNWACPDCDGRGNIE